MKTFTSSLILIGVVALLGGCSGQPEPASPSPNPVLASPKKAPATATAAKPKTYAKPSFEPVPSMVYIGLVGQVQAVNVQAGIITIKHEAVPTFNWPGGETNFPVGKTNISQFKAGDKVEFDVTYFGPQSLAIPRIALRKN